MVGAKPAGRDQDVDIAHSLGRQLVLELAHLVAAQPEAGVVVALDQQARRSIAKQRTQPAHLLERCRVKPKILPRDRLQPIDCFSHPFIPSLTHTYTYTYTYTLTQYPLL